MCNPISGGYLKDYLGSDALASCPDVFDFAFVSGTSCASRSHLRIHISSGRNAEQWSCQIALVILFCFGPRPDVICLAYLILMPL